MCSHSFQDTGFQAVKDSDPSKMENKWVRSHNHPTLLPGMNFLSALQKEGTAESERFPELR